MPTDTPTTETPASAIAGLCDTLDLRANSLIITIFGDAVLPRGGTIWLGDLITLASLFGIGERLVRTGVYRLSQDGWLTSTSKGRRSYYSVTLSGLEKFQAAQRRIYAAGPGHWDNDWRLVQILPAMDQADRQVLRRELAWLGLGQISPTLLAHPSADGALVRQAIEELGFTDDVFVFHATMEDYIGTARIHDIAAQAWALDDLNEEYDAFVRHFRKFAEAFEEIQQFTPTDCLVLRILLIHDYRRILLKDPQLPDDLLSPGWKGRDARELAGRLYRMIAAPSELCLDSAVQALDGAPALASDAFWDRFGGLRPQRHR